MRDDFTFALELLVAQLTFVVGVIVDEVFCEAEAVFEDPRARFASENNMNFFH